MSPRRHGLAAALAAGALVLLAVPTTLLGTASAQDLPDDETPSSSDTPSSEPPAPTVTVTETVTATPTPEPTGAFEVDDAQLRWGLNDETNNRAFAPGTFNFLSAGKVPNPGKGGQTVRNGVWSGTSTRAWFARSGAVRIEKQRSDGGYATATFAGLSTTVAGATMSGTNGPFSGHQVVIDGGTGEVDSDAGTATISWKGSFSVLYYSGMTFFTVTDPVLAVTSSGARLTATLGGYASSMEDQTVWTKVPDRTNVLLADMPKVDLGSALGFSAQPRYRGVRYAAPASGVQQVTTTADWGAWPRSYLDFMGTVGSSAYWYSSGGSADAHKVPQPVTVSYAAGKPVAPPVDDGDTGGSGGSGDGSGGSDDGGSSESPTTAVNPLPPAAVSRPPGPALPSQAPAALPPVAAPTAPAAAAAVVAPAQPAVPPTTYALASSEATTPGPDSEPRWQWWLGSALLLAAAALTLFASRTKGRS